MTDHNTHIRKAQWKKFQEHLPIYSWAHGVSTSSVDNKIKLKRMVGLKKDKNPQAATRVHSWTLSRPAHLEEKIENFCINYLDQGQVLKTEN